MYSVRAKDPKPDWCQGRERHSRQKEQLVGRLAVTESQRKMGSAWPQLCRGPRRGCRATAHWPGNDEV